MDWCCRILQEYGGGGGKCDTENECIDMQILVGLTLELIDGRGKWVMYDAFLLGIEVGEIYMK